MRVHSVYAAAALGATALLGSLAVPAGAATTSDADQMAAKTVWGKATLTGDQEVPGPGDPNGRGRLEFKIHDNTLCYRLQVKRINTPTAAHIHFGKKGEAGPIAVTLKTPPKRGWVEDCITARDQKANNSERRLARWELKGIKEDPRLFYVNVHNKKFPDGAVRGQLRDWHSKRAPVMPGVNY